MIIFREEFSNWDYDETTCKSEQDKHPFNIGFYCDFVAFIIFDKQTDTRLVLAGCFAALLLFGLFYMPMSISADKYAIYIHRSLRIKAIPMSDVKSVKIFPASLRAMRLCGSGGFMGYWGWFREPGIGRYFAYYGDPRDCFLVELASGRKYVLGCRNAGEMVEHIRGLMK